jgi:hypothetical protein
MSEKSNSTCGKWFPISVLRLCVLGGMMVALIACSPEHPTSEVLSSKDMATALAGTIPKGTPLTTAREFMVKEGFECENVVKGKWKKQTGVTFVLCKRVDGTPPVKRIWEVALMHDGSKVTGLDLRSALVYP